MTRTIDIYHPGERFPSVSVTGTVCSMSCAHCNGRYLKGMRDVRGKNSLYKFGMELWRNEGKGILVSGGCSPDGSVPISDDVLEQVSMLKSDTDLLINMHTGLVDEKRAQRIGNAGVDRVSFDLLGDDLTIRNVLKLDMGVEEYRRSYSNLVNAGVEVVPHILAGFNFGRISGEMNAVDIASSFQPEKAVLILLIPTRGTEMEDVEPLSDEAVLSISRYMRSRLNGVLLLGCMRPKGNPDLDLAILDSGFDGIVMPARSVRKSIRNRGWIIREHELCCAL